MNIARKQNTIGLLARQEERAFYMFILPWIIGFVAFTAGPPGILFLQFTLYDVVTHAALGRHAELSDLMKDPLFWQSLKVTALYSPFGDGRDRRLSGGGAALEPEYPRGGRFQNDLLPALGYFGGLSFLCCGCGSSTLTLASSISC